jgi:hypothetical protein
MRLAFGIGVVQALLIQPMQTLVGARTGDRRRAYLSGCWRLALEGIGRHCSGVSNCRLRGLGFWLGTDYCG